MNRNSTEWMALIQECRTSGMSDKQWCEIHNIPMSTFYNTITRLRKKACEIPVAVKHPVYPPQQVVPLTILDTPEIKVQQTAKNQSDAADIPAVTLSIHGFRVEIHNHADKETIENTLLVLQKLC